MRAIFYLLFLGTSWGLYFSLLKFALETGISYVGIATLTTAAVCIGMAIIAGLRRKWPAFGRGQVIFYVTCAILGYLIPMLIELRAVVYMPVGVLTLIVSVAPITTLFFAWLMRTDHVDWRKTIGMLIGTVAIFAILIPDAHFTNAVDWHWLLLVTLVPVSYALYHNVIARYWPEGTDAWQIACGEAIMATILLSAFFAPQWPNETFSEWNNGYTAIVVMSSIALIDIYIYFEVVRLRGPIFVSHANFFMVVSGIVWGMVFFGEQPSSLLWLSALLLVVSLFLITESKSGKLEAGIS